MHAVGLAVPDATPPDAPGTYPIAPLDGHHVRALAVAYRNPAVVLFGRVVSMPMADMVSRQTGPAMTKPMTPTPRWLAVLARWACPMVTGS